MQREKFPYFQKTTFIYYLFNYFKSSNTVIIVDLYDERDVYGTRTVLCTAKLCSVMYRPTRTLLTDEFVPEVSGYHPVSVALYYLFISEINKHEQARLLTIKAENRHTTTCVYNVTYRMKNEKERKCPSSHSLAKPLFLRKSPLCSK